MYKVLLVDDEPVVTKSLHILISWEQLGFVLCGEANDGRTAMKLIRLEKPDVVITDIRMPGKDGLSIIEECTKDPELSIVFIICSGYNDIKYAHSAIRLGVKEYFLKPIDETELSDKLREIHILLSEQENRKKLYEEQKRQEVKYKLLQISRGMVMDPAVEAVRDYLNIRPGQLFGCVDIKIKGNRTGSSRMGLHAEGSAGYTEQAAVISAYLEENYEKLILMGHDFDTLHFFIRLGGKESADVGFYLEAAAASAEEEKQAELAVLAGSMVTDLRQLSVSASGLQRLNEIRFYYNNRKVITAGAFKDFVFCSDLSRLPEPDLLVGVMEEGRAECVLDQVEQLFVQFRGCYVSLDVLQFYINNLTAKISKRAGGAGGEFAAVLEQFTAFLYQIKRADFETVKTNTARFCLKACEALRELRDPDTKGVLGEVEKYIQAHYREHINLKQIAKHFHISTVYLGRLFKQKMGISFNDYINQLRINCAKKYMDTTNLKIYEIAEKTGYINPDYFTSKFQKITGMSPTEYRLSKLNMESVKNKDFEGEN